MPLHSLDLWKVASHIHLSQPHLPSARCPQLWNFWQSNKGIFLHVSSCYPLCLLDIWHTCQLSFFSLLALFAPSQVGDSTSSFLSHFQGASHFHAILCGLSWQLKRSFLSLMILYKFLYKWHSSSYHREVVAKCLWHNGYGSCSPQNSCLVTAMNTFIAFLYVLKTFQVLFVYHYKIVLLLNINILILQMAKLTLTSPMLQLRLFDCSTLNK